MAFVPEDSLLDSSHSSYAETQTETSRKRRKLSTHSESAEENENQIPEPALGSASRVPSRVRSSQTTEQLNIQDTIVSNGKTVDANSSFATLEVSPWLIASLAAMEILRPTAIQKGCIPKILAGRDVIGGSRTGSGKTVAFAVPILQKWAEDPMGVFALVLTPTR